MPWPLLNLVAFGMLLVSLAVRLKLFGRFFLKKSVLTKEWPSRVTVFPNWVSGTPISFLTLEFDVLETWVFWGMRRGGNEQAPGSSNMRGS